MSWWSRYNQSAEGPTCDVSAHELGAPVTPSLAIPCKISSTMPWLMGDNELSFVFNFTLPIIILSFDIQDWCFWVTYDICMIIIIPFDLGFGMQNLKNKHVLISYRCHVFFRDLPQRPFERVFRFVILLVFEQKTKTRPFFLKSKPPRFIPTSCVPCFIFQRWSGNFWPRRVILRIYFVVLAWNGWRFRWLVSQLLFGVLPWKRRSRPLKINGWFRCIPYYN